MSDHAYEVPRQGTKTVTCISTTELVKHWSQVAEIANAMESERPIGTYVVTPDFDGEWYVMPAADAGPDNDVRIPIGKRKGMLISEASTSTLEGYANAYGPNNLKARKFAGCEQFVANVKAELDRRKESARA
jgi:hypothetical protein